MPWGPRREAWCLHPDPKRERPQGYLAAADDLEVAAASASASPHHARAQPAATPARSECGGYDGHNWTKQISKLPHWL